MTEEQVRMARHALGLTNEKAKGRSYRNHFQAKRDSEIEREWDDLVTRGMAEKEREPWDWSVAFCLTKKGALAVLQAGESLDPEDFPQ